MWRHTSGIQVPGGPGATHGGWNWRPSTRQWCHDRTGEHTCAAGSPTVSPGGWTYIPDTAVSASPASAHTTSSSLRGALIGGLTGLVTGGPAGAITGAIGGGFGITRAAPPPGPTAIPGAPLVAGPATCPEGTIRIGTRCVRPAAALPGGDPFVTRATPAVAEAGMFGTLSAAPMTETVTRFVCPSGTVLGKDNRCYAKGSIPNRLRKYPKAPRPFFTAADAKTLRRAETLQKKVKKLAGTAGFTTKKR